MGQKTNPIGLRIALNRDWRSKWYADKKIWGLLAEDHKIRSILKKKLETAAVPRIQIERAATRCRVTIHTARPGVVIGRKGAEIDKVKEELSASYARKCMWTFRKSRHLNSMPNWLPKTLLYSSSVVFARAMKKSLQTTMDFGADGIRIRCAGRLGGAELARVESYNQGRVPLHTLRANIDYGFAEAKTLYGILGVKCWICKGDMKIEKAERPSYTEIG